jgi:hypothetical protein
MATLDLAKRRPLGALLGDAPSSATGPATGGGAGGDDRAALKERLRKYAALLRVGVMAELEPPYGREFVGKVWRINKRIVPTRTKRYDPMLTRIAAFCTHYIRSIRRMIF